MGEPSVRRQSLSHQIIPMSLPPAFHPSFIHLLASSDLPFSSPHSQKLRFALLPLSLKVSKCQSGWKREKDSLFLFTWCPPRVQRSTLPKKTATLFGGETQTNAPDKTLPVFTPFMPNVLLPVFFSLFVFVFPLWCIYFIANAWESAFSRCLAPLQTLHRRWCSRWESANSYATKPEWRPLR